jgi:phenylacetate-CoA ligase
MLEFITRKFVDRGIDPAAFGVRLVGISGGFSTSRARRFVERIWKAAYASSYSCSEVASGEALEDPRSPSVYRPGPTLYCEVVDPDSLEPVAPGEHGRVLVTSLHPFQQVMPFIRYDTGDIAERVATGDEGGGSLAFRPIGRVSDCLRLGPRHFFGTRAVLEALSPFDDIPQVPCPRYRLSLGGRPGQPSIDLSVETVEISDGRRERLRAEIVKTLRAHAWSLPRAATLTCDLVRKGELRDYCRLVPDR